MNAVPGINDGGWYATLQTTVEQADVAQRVVRAVSGSTEDGDVCCAACQGMIQSQFQIRGVLFGWMELLRNSLGAICVQNVSGDGIHVTEHHLWGQAEGVQMTPASIHADQYISALKDVVNSGRKGHIAVGNEDPVHVRPAYGIQFLAVPAVCRYITAGNRHVRTNQGYAMPHGKSKVLVVDDSKMFLQVLVQTVEHSVQAEVISAGSLEETAGLLETHGFDVALLDLNLPDAPGGEIVDLVLSRGIPVIVFAGDCTDQTRKRLWSKSIVDYVVKEGGESLRYAVRQARRVLLNRFVKVLVVEDSDMVRTMVAGLLRVHRFQVFEARNGREGLQVLQQHPDTKLIITDYEMPEMDGVRFIRIVRGLHPKEEMAIIGISSIDREYLSTRFLKSGANDFLTKPFSSEEFYCRISQNMDLLEYIQTIRDYSEKDFLTGLYNRRYLFERGPNWIKKVRKRGAPVWLAMLDIDYFKKINDVYGHEQGDRVLRELGEMLRDRFAAHGIPARLGGEEFCLLLDGQSVDVPTALELFRQEIASMAVDCCDLQVVFSLSIGLCGSATWDLESMLKHADALLYRAKENGRNRMEMLPVGEGCYD